MDCPFKKNLAVYLLKYICVFISNRLEHFYIGETYVSIVQEILLYYLVR